MSTMFFGVAAVDGRVLFVEPWKMRSFLGLEVSYAGRDAVNGSVVAVFGRVCLRSGESLSTHGILWKGSCLYRKSKQE